MTTKKESKSYIITEEVFSQIRESIGSCIPETGFTKANKATIHPTIIFRFILIWIRSLFTHPSYPLYVQR